MAKTYLHPKHKYIVYTTEYFGDGVSGTSDCWSFTTEYAAMRLFYDLWFRSQGEYTPHIAEIDWENEKMVLGVTSKQAVYEYYKKHG